MWKITATVLCLILGSQCSDAFGQLEFKFVADPNHDNLLQVGGIVRYSAGSIVASYDSEPQTVEAGDGIADDNEAVQYSLEALVGINAYGQTVMSLSGISQMLVDPYVWSFFHNCETLFGNLDDPNDDYLHYCSVIDSDVHDPGTPCVLSGTIDMMWQNGGDGNTQSRDCHFIVLLKGSWVAEFEIAGTTVTTWYGTEVPPPPPDTDSISLEDDSVVFPFEIDAEVGDEVEVQFWSGARQASFGTNLLLDVHTFDVNIWVDGP